MTKKHFTLVTSLFSLLCGVASADPITVTHFETIANSASDFPSNTETNPQGVNNWTYGIYNQTANPGIFEAFSTDGSTTLSATNSWANNTGQRLFDVFNGNPPWTNLGVTSAHPNGANNGDIHWATRRYTVESVSNPLANSGITINYSFTHSTGSAGSNGTTVGLLHNGSTITTSTIAGGGNTPGSGSFSGVSVGDTLDFYLSPEGTAPVGGTINHDGSDSSNFSIVYRMEESYSLDGVLIADSVADFPTTGTASPQGLNGWSYGYYNTTANGLPVDGTSFILFNEGSHWDAGGNGKFDLGGGAPWTEVTATGGHPNGINNSANHWATRRYEVQPGEEGEILVEWDVSKSNTGGGDGVTLRVLLNGVEVDSGSIGGTDGIGMGNFVQLSGVQAGDWIDIALDAGASDGSDGSNFSARIFSVPEPGVPSILLLSVGIAFLRRKRRR